MLSSAYTKWTKKPRPDRSWKEAKKYFREALADVKAINKITTGETNFRANAVEERRMNEVSEIVGQSMDNLALAAVTKQATMEMLAQTNTTLAKANAEQQSTITKLTTKITSLASKLEQLSAGVSGGNAGHGHFDPNNYCWSHGYKLAHSHTSDNCTNNNEGHKSDATHRNPIGGNTWSAGYGNAPNGA